MAFADARVVIEALLRDKASRALEAIKRKTANLAPAMQQLGRQMMNTGSAIRSAGQSATIGLTTPIVAAGVAVTKFATDFDDAMAVVSGLTNVSRKQMQEWRKEILALAPEVARPPVELAEALFFLASAGLDVTDVMPALRASAQAAAAGLGETNDIARVVASAMVAYREENLEAADAVGIVIAAVREGNAEVDEFAGTIGRALPIASELGVRFDEVSGAVAALTQVGADAGDAVTFLLGIFRTFLRPSADAKDAMNELGTSFEQLRSKIREEGLLATLQFLSERIGENEEMAGRLFPRVRGLAGFFGLLGQNVAGTEAAMAATAEAGSVDLARAFAETETEGRALRAAFVELQVILIELGQDVVPHVVSGVEKMISAVEAVSAAYNKLPEPLKKVTLGFLAVLAAIGPFLIILGGLITATGAVVASLGAIAGAIIAVKTAAVTANVVGLVPLITKLSALATVLTLAGIGAKNMADDIRENREELTKWERVADVAAGLFIPFVKGLKREIPDTIKALGEFADLQESLEEALLAGTVAGEEAVAMYKDLVAAWEALGPEQQRMLGGFDRQVGKFREIIGLADPFREFTAGIIEDFLALRDHIINTVAEVDVQIVAFSEVLSNVREDVVTDVEAMGDVWKAIAPSADEAFDEWHERTIEFLENQRDFSRNLEAIYVFLAEEVGPLPALAITQTIQEQGPQAAALWTKWFEEHPIGSAEVVREFLPQLLGETVADMQGIVEGPFRTGVIDKVLRGNDDLMTKFTEMRRAGVGELQALILLGFLPFTSEAMTAFQEARDQGLSPFAAALVTLQRISEEDVRPEILRLIAQLDGIPEQKDIIIEVRAEQARRRLEAVIRRINEIIPIIHIDIDANADVPSQQRGTMELHRTGLILAHKGEAVLPAPVAGFFRREGIPTSAGGNTFTINIGTLGQGVTRQDVSTLVDEIERELRSRRARGF